MHILYMYTHTYVSIEYLYIENHEFKPIPQFQTNTIEFIPVFSFSLFPTMRNLSLSVFIVLIYSLSPPEGNQFPIKPPPLPIFM